MTTQNLILILGAAGAGFYLWTKKGAGLVAPKAVAGSGSVSAPLGGVVPKSVPLTKHPTMSGSSGASSGSGFGIGGSGIAVNIDGNKLLKGLGNLLGIGGSADKPRPAFSEADSPSSHTPAPPTVTQPAWQLTPAQSATETAALQSALGGASDAYDYTPPSDFLTPIDSFGSFDTGGFA